MKSCVIRKSFLLSFEDGKDVSKLEEEVSLRAAAKDVALINSHESKMLLKFSIKC